MIFPQCLFAVLQRAPHIEGAQRHVLAKVRAVALQDDRAIGVDVARALDVLVAGNGDLGLPLSLARPLAEGGELATLVGVAHGVVSAAHPTNSRNWMVEGVSHSRPSRPPPVFSASSAA